VKNTTKRYTELSLSSIDLAKESNWKKGTLHIAEEMAGQTLAVNVHIKKNAVQTCSLRVWYHHH
jgi:hypothetical protein